MSPLQTCFSIDFRHSYPIPMTFLANYPLILYIFLTLNTSVHKHRILHSATNPRSLISGIQQIRCREAWLINISAQLGFVVMATFITRQTGERTSTSSAQVPIAAFVARRWVHHKSPSWLYSISSRTLCSFLMTKKIDSYANIM